MLDSRCGVTPCPSCGLDDHIVLAVLPGGGTLVECVWCRYSWTIEEKTK